MRYWFMHYMETTNERDVRPQYGCCIVNEHPLATVRRWNERCQQEGGWQKVILVSWQEITAEEASLCPDMDFHR